MAKGKPTQYYTREETRQALVAIGVQHGAKPERAASLGLRIAALHHESLVEALNAMLSEFNEKMIVGIVHDEMSAISKARAVLSEIESTK